MNIGSETIPSAAVAIGLGPETDTSPLARETIRRVNLRLIPFLFVLYIFNFVDRSNVGFAALQMNEDLKFSSAIFGLGAGMFFVGYALFEVPSNLLLLRFGVRRWIARIMITWGLIAAAMMFVTTPLHFYVLRFLLGVAEAGFYPAIIYYLSQWYPASMRARSGSRFLIAIPLSGAIGGPLSGWLLGFDGSLGLAGWQWLFLVEGLPSVFLGYAALRYLTERPDDAQWLTNEQRGWLAARLHHDRGSSPLPHGLPPLSALRNPSIWLAGIIQTLTTTGGYAYIFWGPTLIREALGASNQAVGWIMGGIAFVSAMGLLLSGALADRSGNRAAWAALWATLLAVACAGAGLVDDPLARVLFLAVMQIAGMAFLAPFVTLPTLLLAGPAVAIGIALVNSIGNIAGFIGPNVVGYLRSRAWGDDGAFIGLSLMALIAASLCLSLRGKIPSRLP